MLYRLPTELPSLGIRAGLTRERGRRSLEICPRCGIPYLTGNGLNACVECIIRSRRRFHRRVRIHMNIHAHTGDSRCGRDCAARLLSQRLCP